MNYTTVRVITRLVAVVCLITASALHATAGSFTAGDLAVLQAAASATNTTASIVELNTTTAGQTPTNTIAIDGTSTNAIRISGSATSTGYVARSNDRTLLTFTGANVDATVAANTTNNANTLISRAVVTLNVSGTPTIPATTYTGTSGNQTRGASTLDNSTWIIGDQGGIYTNGGSTGSPSGNFRSVKTFGGTAYIFQASATIQPVSTLSAPGGTAVALPGLNSLTTANQDFYLVSSGVNGSTFDELYILSATSNTAGIISKFSFVDTNSDTTLDSWTANGTYTTAFGGFGLAAAKDGAGADLFVTTGQGALTANSLLKVFDAAGYNTAINVTTANNVTLFTAATGNILKGLDFVPVAVPEPSTFVLAGLGLVGVAVASRRRRSS